MITLSSDFGSPYPAAMRGVILQRTDTRIVDITHQFPRQDVRTAAFWLREIVPWFPSAVHCSVVDPGVGTDRDALVGSVGDHQFVAPDNGLVVPTVEYLAEQDNVTPQWYAVQWDSPASSTFHGRDIFAPVAAEVHQQSLSDLVADGLLVETAPTTELSFPDPKIESQQVIGEVLVVDGFGNAVTNIPGDLLSPPATVEVNDMTVPFRQSFAHVPVGDPLVTVGSHGNFELAVNQGRGDQTFDTTVGDRVVVRW